MPYDDIDEIVAEALSEPPERESEEEVEATFERKSLAEYTDEEVVDKAKQLYTLSEGFAPYASMKSVFEQLSASLSLVIEEGRRRGINDQLLAACERTRW